jgi:protein KRI1
MTLRDYEQKLVTERGGKFSDEDDEAEFDDAGPSYTEKEAQLKQDLKNALNNFPDDEEDFLKKRVKSVDEQKAEEDEYHEWLKGHRHEIPEMDENLVSFELSYNYLIRPPF